MNSVIGTTHQIPSLSFSLSTPPEVSIDEEDCYPGMEEGWRIDTDSHAADNHNSVHSCVDPSAKERGMKNEKLVRVANELVRNVISQAQDKAQNVPTNEVMEEAETVRNIDPKVMEMVRQFVSDVLSKAKEEAVRTIKNNESATTINNNNIYSKSKENVDSQSMRRQRRGPWYSRAIRFLSTVLGRVCPCRTSVDS